MNLFRTLLVSALFATPALYAQLPSIGSVKPSAMAEKWQTRTAYVRFFSTTPVEDIEAVNNQVSSILDPLKGEFAFQVPIKGFVFEKALMQEHFNENYLESGKHPNASFTGKIVDFDPGKLTGTGKVKLVLRGKMTIHGQEKEMDIPVELTPKAGKGMIEAKFKVVPEDFGIKIPSAVRNKIAKDIEVSVKADYAG
ncbi:YceI family protein [bacterium]|nr:YceI family protein [bacterium]